MASQLDKQAVLIAGPTASGKSALALAVARRIGGIIVNADSMQVYRELAILTARPSPEDEAAVPHALYGHLGAAEPYSVAHWLRDVATVLSDASRAARTPVIVGGTGLYFKALLEGLSPVPAVPHAIRQHWRRMAGELDPGRLHAELARRDPGMAARLNPADRQRVTRALEVVDATGRSLADWQRQPGNPLLAAEDCLRIVVLPPREVLHARSDRRLDRMMAEDALQEVRALLALGLPATAPAMGALGVEALAAHLAGRLGLAEAVAAAKAATRQYVKRQETWLRRHMITWNTVQNIESCNLECLIERFIDR